MDVTNGRHLSPGPTPEDLLDDQVRRHLGKVAWNALGILQLFLMMISQATLLLINIAFLSNFLILQITLKKISLTALPSGASYGACIEEPDAQYSQGDTVVAR